MTPLNQAQVSTLALIDKTFIQFPNFAYVDRVWVMAHVRVESGFNAAAVGGDGSLGLMQVIPSTAQQMGETGSQLDAETSLRTGIKYLDFCAREIIRAWKAKYDPTINSISRATLVEAYNEGPGGVEAGRHVDAYWYKVYAAWQILNTQVVAAHIMSTQTMPSTLQTDPIVTPP